MAIKNTKISSYTSSDTSYILDHGERMYVLKINDMPQESRPREKLIHQGTRALSLQELLSVILNTGTRGEGVFEMSHRIIKEYGEKSIIAVESPVKLASELSIPLMKACQIVACAELGRRLFHKHASGFVVIRNAKDVHEHLKDMYNLPKEHLRGLYLNSHNQIIHDEVISIGTINANIIHPREVFRPALEYNAVAVVLAHNHPSGVATPSAQDIEITEQIVKAGKIIGISVLDHVVITKESYISINAHY